MIYMRGQAEDFDGWRQLGLHRLGLLDVCPTSRSRSDQQRGANEYHAADGPLWVSDLPSKHELADAFIAAGHELGSPLNDDFNGADAGRRRGMFRSRPETDAAGAPPLPI